MTTILRTGEWKIGKTLSLTSIGKDRCAEKRELCWGPVGSVSGVGGGTDGGGSP